VCGAGPRLGLQAVTRYGLPRVCGADYGSYEVLEDTDGLPPRLRDGLAPQVLDRLLLRVTPRVQGRTTATASRTSNTPGYPRVCEADPTRLAKFR
jgi:hypothetical protein